MSQEIPIGQQPSINIEELFRQKGEVVTQLEIAQQKLQLINAQLSQFFTPQGIKK